VTSEWSWWPVDFLGWTPAFLGTCSQDLSINAKIYSIAVHRL
jgi:hypothetical protein